MFYPLGIVIREETRTQPRWRTDVIEIRNLGQNSLGRKELWESTASEYHLKGLYQAHTP